MNFSIFNFQKIVLNLKGFFKWRKKEPITKENAQILFIDDVNFPVIANLTKAGWSVKRVRDLKNIDEPDVKRAHIIFVDYKGVGRTLAESDEGIGLIRLIKQEYKSSKRVILYSEYGKFSLGEHLREADNQLPKASDTYEFIKMIESELKKLNASI